MRASWSTLPHQLRIAGIALLASWTTVLSWRVLTEDFGEVAIPLLLIGVVLAGAGALARWSRLPGLAIVAGQLVLGGLLVLGTTTGSPIPTPSNVDTFMAALSDALETSRSYAAPVQSGVPPVHPLLLIGGTLVVLLVDLIACTMRRAPVAGLVLLAAYTLPVAVTGDAVSWWLFAVIAGLFLTLVFIQHSDHVTSWGRAPDGEKGSFSVRTGAIGNTALALGATAIALAVVVPVAVPTMSMSVFEGNGPGTREVEVQDPMVDLRRDLRRGEDIPLLWVTTLGPKPTYLRISVLSRFSGSQWTPGDREIPESQAATGALPPLDGVALDVPRREFKYDVRVGPDFASTWLPTAAQTTRIAAGNDWRYDLDTRDVIAAREGITTADSTYDYTGVQLELRRRPDELRGVRCRLGGRDLHRGAEHAQQRDPPAGGEHHRGRTHALPEGAGAAAVVPRGRRLPLRPQRGRRQRATAARTSSRSSTTGSATASSSRRRWRSWRASSASRAGWRSASSSPSAPPTARGSSPRATCTPGPSSTSRDRAGCASSPPPRPAPASRRTTPRRSSPRSPRRPRRAPPAPVRTCPSAARMPPPTRPPTTAAPRRSPGSRSSPACSAWRWWVSCCSRPGWSARRGAAAASTGTSRTSGSSSATSPSTWATPGRWAGRPDAPASGSATCWRRPSTTARDPTARDAVATRPPRRLRPSTGSSRLSSAAATPATPRPSPPTTSPATSSSSRSPSSPG